MSNGVRRCVLALDGAGATVAAGIFAGPLPLHELAVRRQRGHASVMPALVGELLAATGADIDIVAVCVGPGSFTGLRGAIGLAHGIAASRSCPIVAVAAAEALEIKRAAPWNRTVVEDVTVLEDVMDARDAAAGAVVVGSAATLVAPSVLQDLWAIAVGGVERWQGLRPALPVAPVHDAHSIAGSRADGSE